MISMSLDNKSLYALYNEDKESNKYKMIYWESHYLKNWKQTWFIAL